MKKQAFFRFWLIVCIIALTVPFASCDEIVEPAETTAEIIETVEITNVPDTTIIPETTSEPETTKVPGTTSAPETTNAPETTSVPETTKVPETTSAPETTNAPETTEAPHVHAWSLWATVLKATCTAEGKQERACSCGEKETESISALGHTEVIDKAVAATCTKNGKSEGKHCSVCKVVLVAQEVVEAIGHVYGEWTVTTPATCTIKGRQERKCTCGQKEWQTIDKLEHSYGEWTVTKSATCTANGREERVCSCGKKEWQTIDKLGHSYGEWTVTTPATCTIKGRQERTCSTCSKKENQAIAALGHTESEWIIDKEPTCQTEGSQHTVCTVCNKTASTQTIEKLNREHTYEGGFCSSCGKISPDFSFPSGYITTEPIEIETEYCILKIDEYVYVVDGVAEKVDIVCRAIEEVTGLKFKNDTYGKDKFVINVTHGEKPWGLTGESETPKQGITVTFTREITISPRCLFICDSSTLIHELAHALHFSQTKWTPNKYFVEGYATYVTHLTLQYLAEHHTHIQYSFGSTDNEICNERIYTDELYKESIEYWLKHPFTHMPNYHSKDEYYAIGFRIIWYLHDSYGDYQKWIFYRESKTPSTNNHHATVSDEELFAELEQIYGENIFNNFYNWLKVNEKSFEWDTSTAAPSDLTSIQYVNLYPMFDASTMFFETGRITYNKLYINLEEGIKYLIEYKGKCVTHLGFRFTEGILISYYDKYGNLLYESNKELWFGTEVSYIKLNGSGSVKNLQLFGVTNYEENGLGFVIDTTSHYELHYIFDCQDSHLIIPSEANGIPVKGIENMYGGTLDQIIEITVSEGIEELLYINLSFSHMPNLKVLHLPSTIKRLQHKWSGVKAIEIHYAGTKSDWNAIQKADNWDSWLTSYTIHCTDGDITKGS